MCCPTCDCLGYCSKREHGDNILLDRPFEDFKKSVESGCSFCSLALEGSALLRAGGTNSRLAIQLYSQASTELCSLPVRGQYDGVQIYASDSKHSGQRLWLKNEQLKYFVGAEQTDSQHPKLGSNVPTKPYSRESQHFLEDNYNTCQKVHEDCRQVSSLLPKRIIDISRSQFRLVESECGQTGTYAALSYSWGVRGYRVATSQNYEKLKVGIDRDSLPIVFQDAAGISQRLHVNYLWIDTLCIIQDSKSDWENEAAKMADIFENAAITIAASSSPNPRISLFTTRSSTYQQIRLNTRQYLAPVFNARRRFLLGSTRRTLCLRKPIHWICALGHFKRESFRQELYHLPKQNYSGDAEKQQCVNAIECQTHRRHSSILLWQFLRATRTAMTPSAGLRLLKSTLSAI